PVCEDEYPVGYLRLWRSSARCRRRTGACELRRPRRNPPEPVLGPDRQAAEAAGRFRQIAVQTRPPALAGEGPGVPPKPLPVRRIPATAPLLAPVEMKQT